MNLKLRRVYFCSVLLMAGIISGCAATYAPIKQSYCQDQPGLAGQIFVSLFDDKFH